MPEVEAGAKHAAKSVGYEVVDVVIDYLIPIAGALTGLVAGPSLFGGLIIQNSLATTVGQNGGSDVISNNTCVRLGGAILAVITAGIGYAFWRLGKRDGWIMKVIGKGVGSFFLGTAAAYTFGQVISAKNCPSGLLDMFAGGIEGIAKGG